jgi:hypothetical protein
MGRIERPVEECPHRCPVSLGDGKGLARCGLLATITGVDDPHLTCVRYDGCAACSRSFPPSVDELNPVVASLLYDLSSRIIERGGVAGCHVLRARELNRKAAGMLPTEEDLHEAPPGSGRPAGQASAAPESLFEIIPPPSRRTGPQVKRWAVGVTTAPRQVPTLVETLASLASAGWDRPRLFVDGPVAIPEEFAGLPRTSRDPLMGAWPNYYLSLAELLMREPRADAYLLVQDDVRFATELPIRDYLERILWPGDQAGIVSIFCCRAYTQPRPGWYRFNGVWRWGALAFVFSRDAAQHFLADIDVVQHRWSRDKEGLAGIDGCIGRWASYRKVPVYYPTPSLIQHIGDVSSLWKGQRALGNRRATWFASK